MVKFNKIIILLLLVSLSACETKAIASNNGNSDGVIISDNNENIKSVNTPIVLFTSDISPTGLNNIYKALGREAKGNNVAVKISTGEGKESNNLKPEFIGDFVKQINGTIVECNTAVGGRRANTMRHYQLAKEKGYNDIANVVIMDDEKDIEIPVVGGKHLKNDLVGGHFTDFDFHVVLSHFKGHLNGGFGGAIKNLSIGYASSAGKNRIHTGGKSDSAWLRFGAAEQDDFLESMAEAAKAVVDYCNDKIIYINVMNRLSVDCDCVPTPREPTMADIGILASLDPVALDKACVDLVYAAPDGQDLINRIESLNGTHTLDYAEEIGLGSKTYSLINIDNNIVAFTNTDLNNKDGKEYYTDINGDKAVIPAGFSVSSKDDEKIINKGLVVIGTDGSEYVWVPTKDLSVLERSADIYDRYWTSDYYDETNLNSYQEMKKSVEKYGGFYIGRYEASKGANNLPLSKRVSDSDKGQIWVRFSPQDATKACEKLYDDNDSVQGFFLWGINWDTTLKWLIESGDKTENEVLNDSSSWGNYSNDTFSKNARGNYTGIWEEAKANNIYDLAGNNWEWTQERYGSNYVMRGGGYNMMGGACPGSNYPASIRDPLPGNNHHPNVVFRVGLYLK